MNRRTLLASACLGLAAMVPSAPAWADKLDDITKAGVVRVAVLAEYPPYGSVGPDMQPVGFDIDLTRAVAQKLGVKVEMIPTTGPNRIPLLQTNKVDIIIGCLGRNAEREKVIDYGPAYAMEYNAVFGSADEKASKPEDFAGKTVAVVRGSTEDLGFSAVAPAGVEIKRFEDNNGTQSAFQSGQVQFVVTSPTTAAELNKNNTRKLEEKMIVANGEDWRSYIGLGKGEPALKAKLTEIVGELRKDGTLSTITQTWLKSDVPADL